MDKERTKLVLWNTAKAMSGLIISAISWLINIQTWSLIGTVLGLIICGVVIFSVLYKSQEKIDGFENSRPILVPSPRCAVFPVIPISYVPNTTTTTTTESSLHVSNINSDYPWLNDDQISSLGAHPTSDLVDLDKPNQSWFALVEFLNQPLEPIDKSVAKDVSAHIFYYDKDKKPRINEKGISGRWWSNEEVALSNKPRRELERTDILPNSQPVTLALACMGVRDSAIYGYNNDNHEYKDFKLDKFSLGLGSYYVCVVLSGINLKKTKLWFSIWRDKISGELKIKGITEPKVLGK